jgi:ADP-dependent phosphofructokinase/glucokinase
MTYKNININLLSLPKVRVATGLYSHWDSVVKINQDILNWTKEAYKEKPKDIILNSLEEVAYTISEALENGGKEFLVSEDVYKRLNQFFSKREFRVGGNGYYMGNMLFLAGLTPVVSFPTRSKKLMESCPELKVVSGYELKRPKESIRITDLEYDHIIIELENSRHILSWDPPASKGIFDNDFLNFSSRAENIDILILSYAHLLLPSYKSRTDEIIELLNGKRPKVHLEFGLGSTESMKYAMKEFSENKSCESWGLNEIECKTYLRAHSQSLEDLKESALNAIKEYNIDRICVHTPEFAFSISKYEMVREYRALIIACLFAAARTFGNLKLKVAKTLPTTVEPIKEKIGIYNFCLVPSLINKFPTFLTGIGDSFAAVQAVKILS